MNTDSNNSTHSTQILPNILEPSRSTETKFNNCSAWRHYNKATEEINTANADRKNLKKQIRCGWKHTAGRIFNDFLKARNTGKLYCTENDSTGYLETSDALIKKTTGFPRQTVRGHIERLIEVGFIVEKVQNLSSIKKTRGYNFFLKINPVFLYTKQKVPIKLKINKLYNNF